MISQTGSEPASALSKPSLRRLMRSTLAALDPAERGRKKSADRRASAVCPGFAQASAVLLFVSALPEEPRTIDLFALAYQSRKTVLCPRVDRRARRLSIHRIADPHSELVPGILGIPEPRPGLPEVAPVDHRLGTRSGPRL